MTDSQNLETLKREIDAKKSFVASLTPRPGNKEEIFELAKHQKILGEKEEEYELILEKQRRASVVREHEEVHPPKTEECPICLEEIKITSQFSMSYFGCCGNGCCSQCNDSGNKRTSEGVDVLGNCPLCRAEFPHVDDRETQAQLKHERAKDGRSWAQFEIAMNYLDREGRFPIDTIEGMKWLKLAAEQHHPAALTLLAEMYSGRIPEIYGGRISVGNEVTQSFSKSRALMKEAADQGYTAAQIGVGRMYHEGEGGPVDEAKAAYYSTLAYDQDADPQAGYQLGYLFFGGLGGLDKSLYRARHYFGESAKKGHIQSYGSLALAQLKLCEAQYSPRMGIPGHNCIPRVLFWARKAVACGEGQWAKLVDDLEKDEQLTCANCHRHALRFSEKLKRFTRCKAAWYCGMQCQQQHWRDGHKIDCVKYEE